MSKKIILMAMTYFLLAATPFNVQLDPKKREELGSYLKTHWMSPEEYVVEKFKTYDFVFLGEMHRVNHDVELVHNLIPLLYKAGIYNLGIEFGAAEMQEQVDKLISASAYDEALARQIHFKWSTYWGYKEYMDIYRKAWEVNHSLPKEAKKFRVVNLDYHPRYEFRQETMTEELVKKVYFGGDRDEHMAKVIVKEFIEKGQKAMIYCGAMHAQTHYHHPVPDAEGRKMEFVNEKRMGNRIYKLMPDKVFFIFLHSPWASREDWAPTVCPVGGQIDALMNEFKDKRVGFDVKGTPFGKLSDNESIFSVGYFRFYLEDYCDGYIFQKPLSEYQGCTVDPLFITAANVKEAVRNFDNYDPRFENETPESLFKMMANDANMQNRFAELFERYAGK